MEGSGAIDDGELIALHLQFSTSPWQLDEE